MAWRCTGKGASPTGTKEKIRIFALNVKMSPRAQTGMHFLQALGFTSHFMLIRGVVLILVPFEYQQ